MINEDDNFFLMFHHPLHILIEVVTIHDQCFEYPKNLYDLYFKIRLHVLLPLRDKTIWFHEKKDSNETNNSSTKVYLDYL